MKKLLFFSILAISFLFSQPDQGWDDDNLGVPGNLLVWGNVGIGTTSPYSAFEIKQRVDNYVGGILLRESGTNDTWSLTQNPFESFVFAHALSATGGDEAIDFVTKFWITKDGDIHAKGDLLVDGIGDSYVMGNVGIGDATPSSTLDLLGTFLLGDNANNATIYDNRAEVWQYFSTDATPSWNFWSAGITNLVFTNSGGGIVNLSIDGSIQMDGDLLVDGGDIGITADSDLMQLAANLFTVNGDIQAALGGIGIARTDGTLHVHTATAGVVAASANADGVVIENSVPDGLSFLVPDASTSSIYFGSPSDNIGAFIDWTYSTSAMSFGSHKVGGVVTLRSGNFAAALTLDADQDALFAGNVDISGTLTHGSPSFSVYQADTSQSGILTSTYTKVRWDHKDSGADWNDSGFAIGAGGSGGATNSRWTPGKQGLYHYDGAVWMSAGGHVDQELFAIILRINGVNKHEWAMKYSGNGNFQSGTLSVTVFMDDDDYAELFMWQSSGNTQRTVPSTEVSPLQIYTWWTGYKAQ